MSKKERLVPLSEVANRAGLTLRTIQNHVAKGALKVVRVGPYKRIRVRESDVERYVGNVDDDATPTK